jgi:hypothetical protein
MTDDIFSEPAQQQVEKSEPTFEERVAQQLASLKREDGSQMFDSVEKALESLAHAQKYIPELKGKLSEKEREVQELSIKVEKAATVEDVLSRITGPKSESPVNPEVKEGNKEDIGELVKKHLEQERQAERKAANRSQVNEALITKFGNAEAAKLALDAKATELGVNTDFLISMADHSPKALMAFFNTPSGGVPSPTTSSVNIRKDVTSNKTTGELESFSLSKTSSRDQVEIMKKIKENVHNKYNVQV